jgi:hypothetical protein
VKGIPLSIAIACLFVIICIMVLEWLIPRDQPPNEWRVSTEQAKRLFPTHSQAIDDGCAYVVQQRYDEPRLSFDSVSNIGEWTWYLVTEPGWTMILDGRTTLGDPDTDFAMPQWECVERTGVSP